MSAIVQELAEVNVERLKWNVRDYERLIQTGFFGEDERIELISGELVTMPPISSGHSGHVKRLNRVLANKLGARATIGVQDPIRLDDESEPQPDFSILKPRADDYTDSHPTPSDVFWLIEVAETSVDYDRKTKARLYARAGITELWVVDLRANQIEVFREPSPEEYRAHQIFARGDEIHPLAFPDVTFPVNEILRAA